MNQTALARRGEASSGPHSSNPHRHWDKLPVQAISLPAPLIVEFRDAYTDPVFASRYLREVLQPGVECPAESPYLYNADEESLSDAGAIIGLGWVGDQIAAGLYITLDGNNTAWMNGVRVREKFRRRGYGSAMARDALAYISNYLCIRHCALTVFCDNKSVPNKSAFAMYEDCGFRQVELPYPVVVAGSLCDRHLGAAGTELLAVQMDAWS